MRLGFANDRDLIEIYNAHQRLDPYHELTHIVTGPLGNPPALFNEGFAIYMTESLGANALEYVTEHGTTVDQAACSIIRAGQLIPLDSLLRLDEFGDKGGIGYPESGAIVKYLVEHFGLPAVREAYRSLVASDDPALQAKNVQRLTEVFGHSPRDIETAWRGALGC